MSALAGTVPRDPVSTAYRIGLVLAVVMMVMLPLAYLVLTFGVGWALLGYISHASMWVSDMRGPASVKAFFLLVVGPVCAGVVLILFMFKPFFAPRVKAQPSFTLTRPEQPMLFEFVARLCRQIGAPEPREIRLDCDVNASASFRRGVFSVFGHDLVLTIGLPLVSGFTLRQFTSVLAHEFGHFRQGGGMRLTFFVRSIDQWFARVVYQRDALDEWLVSLSYEGGWWPIPLFALLARGMVWLTRRVLWLLMMAGHLVSSFLLRQMEFDADRVACRVAGSACVAKLSADVAVLSVAQSQTFDQLSDLWREKRLADDLPGMIALNEKRFDQPIRDKVKAHFLAEKTAWLDTHPSAADRTRAAWSYADPGTLNVDCAASALFERFDDVCRRATLSFYFSTLGPSVRPENLVPLVATVERHESLKKSYNALGRYFQGLVHPLRPVFLDAAPQPAADIDSAAESLLALRSKFLTLTPAAATAPRLFDSADDRLIAAGRVAALRAAGFKKIDLASFGMTLGTAEEIAAVRTSAEATTRSSRDALAPVLALGLKRLSTALSIQLARKQASATRVEAVAPEDDFGAYEVIETPASDALWTRVEALATLKAAAPQVEMMRQATLPLGPLLGSVRPDNNPQKLVDEIVRRSHALHRALSAAHDELKNAKYPFEHSEAGVTIARYVCPVVPPVGQIGPVYDAATTMLEAIYTLYMRVFSALAHDAESVESELGLLPCDPPPDTPGVA